MEKVLFRFKNGHQREMTKRQADALLRARVGVYSTRHLEAAPVAPVQVFAPPPTPDPEPVADPLPIVDLDSEGNAWDADLHVSTKLKNADGTWRKRPGAKTQE